MWSIVEPFALIMMAGPVWAVPVAGVIVAIKRHRRRRRKHG